MLDAGRWEVEEPVIKDSMERGLLDKEEEEFPARVVPERFKWEGSERGHISAWTKKRAVSCRFCKCRRWETMDDGL